jgi:vitamin B12 transporter
VVLARASDGAIGETSLKTSAGLGIKEPTVLQSFSLSPYFHGNASLEPERARTIEAGIEQRLAGGRAKVEATWFDNRFRNLIATRTIDPATFAAEYFNIGLSRARGVEVGAEAAPHRTLRGRVGYTFLASEIVDSTSSFSVVFQPGQPLFRRPRHSGFIGATWTGNRVTADVNGVRIGRFVDSDFSSLSPAMVTSEGRTTWDARLAVTVTRQVTGTLSIDNAANADYMEPLGYPALRRAVRVGLRMAF